MFGTGARAGAHLDGRGAPVPCHRMCGQAFLRVASVGGDPCQLGVSEEAQGWL